MVFLIGMFLFVRGADAWCKSNEIFGRICMSFVLDVLFESLVFGLWFVWIHVT